MAASARRIIVLGATGSIGRSTLEAIRHLRALGQHWEVAGLAAGTRADELFAQAAELGVRHLALAGLPADGVAPPTPHGATLFRGADSALELIEAIAQPGDLVLGAMVGAAGLQPTIAAIERGCDIALANKETLVAAGAIVMPLAAAKGVRLLPVDSEHSAIFQCVQAGRCVEEIERLVITASGGPFRTWDAARMNEATVEEALNHPTWKMGPKVTIDSASMMNKALEMIEAFWLFGIPAERIDPIIHPQSIVHSFVEFVDGSVIAQLSPPDMKMPIQYAMTHPHRVDGCSRRLDWSALSRLDFEPVDERKFRSIALARRVLAAGGTSGAVLNAANEVAVEAFLDRRIRFGRIAELVEEALNAVPAVAVRSLAEITSADEHARAAVRQALAACAEPVSSRTASR